MAGLDLADMLARNLRAGIMDELHRPAQDAANATFSSPARQYDTDGPFPYWVMSHRDSTSPSSARCAWRALPGRRAGPRVSCPALVAEVSAHHGFSEDAATYWLQLATLAEPHRDTILRINGWTDEVLEDASHELLPRGRSSLSIAARRASRRGRLGAKLAL